MIVRLCWEWMLMMALDMRGSPIGRQCLRSSVLQLKLVNYLRTLTSVAARVRFGYDVTTVEMKKIKKRKYGVTLTTTVFHLTEVVKVAPKQQKQCG